MSDEYAKTLVISDPNYRPGDIVPPAMTPEIEPATPVSPVQHIEDDGPMPTFEDTSWLT